MGYYTTLKMNYYTTFRFKGKLKKDTPETIIAFLKKIVIDQDLGDKAIFHIEDISIETPEDIFFNCSSWYMLFLSNNSDNTLQGSNFNLDTLELSIESEFKNYGQEIKHFTKWISQYVESFEGTLQGEDWEEPYNLVDWV